MQAIQRERSSHLKAQLARGKSVLLLGPPQVGKTTLIQQIQTDLEISLMLTDVRHRYEGLSSAVHHNRLIWDMALWQLTGQRGEAF